METFWNALHVLLAVFVVGPLVFAPITARRGIRHRDAGRVRRAAHQAALSGAGSVVVAGLGVVTVLAGDRWTMATPWVLISTTLYVVALGLVFGYTWPALRRAAGVVAATTTAGADRFVVAGDASDADDRPDATGTSGDRGAEDRDADHGNRSGTAELPAADRPDEPDGHPDGHADGHRLTGGPEDDARRLENIAARVTGAGWLLLLTFGVITVLMTVRPFG